MRERLPPPRSVCSATTPLPKMRTRPSSCTCSRRGKPPARMTTNAPGQSNHNSSTRWNLAVRTPYATCHFHHRHIPPHHILPPLDKQRLPRYLPGCIVIVARLRESVSRQRRPAVAIVTRSSKTARFPPLPQPAAPARRSHSASLPRPIPLRCRPVLGIINKLAKQPSGSIARTKLPAAS